MGIERTEDYTEGTVTPGRLANKLDSNSQLALVTRTDHYDDGDIITHYVELTTKQFAALKVG